MRDSRACSPSATIPTPNLDEVVLYSVNSITEAVEGCIRDLTLRGRRVIILVPNAPQVPMPEVVSAMRAGALDIQTHENCSPYSILPHLNPDELFGASFKQSSPSVDTPFSSAEDFRKALSGISDIEEMVRLSLTTCWEVSGTGTYVLFFRDAAQDWDLGAYVNCSSVKGSEFERLADEFAQYIDRFEYHEKNRLLECSSLAGTFNLIPQTPPEFDAKNARIFLGTSMVMLTYSTGKLEITNRAKLEELCRALAEGVARLSGAESRLIDGL